MSGWRGICAIVAVAVFAGSGLAGCSQGTSHTVVYSLTVTEGSAAQRVPVKQIQLFYAGDGDGQTVTVDAPISTPWSKSVTFRARHAVTALSMGTTFDKGDVPSDQWPFAFCKITLDGKEMVTSRGQAAVSCGIDKDQIKQTLGG